MTNKTPTTDKRATGSDAVTQADPAKEIEALKKVSDALRELKPEAIQRILAYTADAFGLVAPARIQSRQTALSENSVPFRGTDSSTDEFGSSDLADFFASKPATTGPVRALVVGYWLQVIEKGGGFDGQTLNTHLKHLGHPLSNVTTTLTSLMTQKPALVMQTGKTGKSHQARKRYKLTQAGMDRVRKMDVPEEPVEK